MTQTTVISGASARRALVAAEGLVDLDAELDMLETYGVQFDSRRPSDRVVLPDELTVADAHAAFDIMQAAWLDDAQRQLGFWGDALADLGGALNVVAAFYWSILDHSALAGTLPSDHAAQAKVLAEWFCSNLADGSALYAAGKLIDEQAAARFEVLADPEIPEVIAEAVGTVERARDAHEAQRQDDLVAEIRFLCDTLDELPDPLVGVTRDLLAVLADDIVNTGETPASAAVMLGDCERELLALR